MRLLIITQKVAQQDPILGFFHRWIEEFAKHYEKITVICLEEGEHNLPENVKVLSLGKEKNKSRINYVINFLHYIWRERNNYDAVFVHMNQEYVILGWKFWKLWGKKIYMWRNHAYGNIWTRLAVLVSDKVFYTSPQSFTAKYKKSVQMPVGIDTNFFKPDPNAGMIPNSVLFLGRIAPVKKASEFIDWLKTTNYTATIAGPIGDEKYWESVKSKIKNLGLEDRVKFVGSVNQEGARKLYQTHEIYVNMTPAGSFDKTILEALACGCKIKTQNPAAEKNNIKDHNLKELLCRLEQEIK
jgi:glycosyltransferase involved in cell wall biosynthesis